MQVVKVLHDGGGCVGHGCAGTWQQWRERQAQAGDALHAQTDADEREREGAGGVRANDAELLENRDNTKRLDATRNSDEKARH